MRVLPMSPAPTLRSNGGVQCIIPTEARKEQCVGNAHRLAGLHVPEDLVHLDVYDPRLKSFVKDGECGRSVLTTLLPVGGKTGCS